MVSNGHVSAITIQQYALHLPEVAHTHTKLRKKQIVRVKRQGLRHNYYHRNRLSIRQRTNYSNKTPEMKNDIGEFNCFDMWTVHEIITIGQPLHIDKCNTEICLGCRYGCSEVYYTLLRLQLSTNMSVHLL